MKKYELVITQKVFLSAIDYRSKAYPGLSSHW
jgi:hypothetical protein